MIDVARQLLRAIRGERSQEAFSRRLGYTSNPVADWEAGRRMPRAAEALRAARIAGIDVAGAFQRFRTAEAPRLGAMDDAGVAAWLQALLGKRPLRDVCAAVGQTRFTVSRWLSGRTRPRLPDFLALVEALTGRLSDLVAELVPIADVPALRAHHEAKQQSRRLAFDAPWTEAVLRVLETEDYRALRAHRPGFVAERLRIEDAIEADALSRLAAAGIIAWDGRRWASSAPFTVDTRAEPGRVAALKAHWSEVALRRIGEPGEGDLFSYNVLSVSRADLARIREMHLAYFRELRAVVAASEPVEVAALVNVQLMGWDA